jgi:cystathionine beta-lyase/cystathionine gamma-synthase
MYRFDTLAIHAGQPNDAATGAVTIPIYQTSTFEQLEPGVHRGFGYARTEHPTRRALEECLASLEGARYGLAFASGMAAIHNVLSLLRHGDHVVSTQDLYGGAWNQSSSREAAKTRRGSELFFFVPSRLRVLSSRPNVSRHPMMSMRRMVMRRPGADA